MSLCANKSIKSNKSIHFRFYMKKALLSRAFKIHIHVLLIQADACGSWIRTILFLSPS